MTGHWEPRIAPGLGPFRHHNQRPMRRHLTEPLVAAPRIAVETEPGHRGGQERMIAVLASAGVWADVKSVTGHSRCRLAADQSQLLRFAGDAHAVVVEALDLAPILGVLRDIKEQHPFLSIILVTEQDTPDVGALSSLAVEAVLFRHQITAHLPAALRYSGRSAFRLRVLGEEFGRNEAIPAPLRRLLTCVLTAAPPPRTVQQLARLLKSHPSTIRRHWRRGVSSNGIQRVKDLLDWIVLLNALSVKQPGLSWRVAARRIGAHESTLRRLALRLTGDTLGALASVGATRLLERFAETLAESFCAHLH